MLVRPVCILDAQVKQLRQGDKDNEGALGWDDTRDDVGDGGSHEEVLSSFVFW